MACFKPLTAWRGALGKIVFAERFSLSKVAMQLPCGRCIGCRMDRASSWGARCVHEAKQWDHNCFVTLTYNDASLPPGNSLMLRDVQLFMKRLRKSRSGCTIRFFLAGEYGEKDDRPHYHALLFNCGFPDLERLFVNVRGEQVYKSKELEDLWGHGFCTVGALTAESAVYCAKYALKRLDEGNSAESREAFNARYEVFDEDGVVYTRKREFAVMSRRPGIGREYYDKFGGEVRAHDNVIIDGKEVPPPRYYDVLTEREDPATLERLKRKRRRLSVLRRFDNTPERLRVKERIALIAADRAKERKL